MAAGSERTGNKGQRLLPYAGALLLVFAATLLRMALTPWVGTNTPFNTFYVAVALAAWRWGNRPALLAMLCGYLAADYFIIPPLYRIGLELHNPLDVVRTGSYFAVTLAFIGISSALRQRRDEAAAARLEARASEEELALISNTVPSLISYFGTDCRYRFCNRTYADWFGINASELPGRALREVVGEPAWRTIQPHVARALSGQEADFEAEVSYPRRTCWIHATYIPHRNPQGNVVGVVAMVSDISARKQTERTLRESEKKFAALFQKAPFATVLSRVPHGAFVDVNEAFERITGFSRAEMLGRNAVELGLVPAELREQISAELQERGLVRNQEVSFGSKNGEFYKVLLNVDLLEFGGEQYALTTIEDITHRRRAEDQLALERERLSLALNAGMMGVYDMDLRQNRLWWSPEIYAVFGLSPQTFVPSRDAFKALVHPEDRDSLWNSLEESVRDHKPFTYEFRVVRPDGQLRWIATRARSEYDSAGSPVHYFGIAIDITERKRVEEALIESQERFRQLAENIPQMAWMTDRDGSIFWYNKLWFEYTGSTLEEMRGWGWQKVHHPDYVQSVTEKFKRALATGEPWEDTFPLRRHDGEFRWFLSRAFPIHDGEGNIARWFGTNTDITQLRQAQANLAEREAILRTVTTEARVGLVIVNSEQRYLFANRTYAEILGIATENIVGLRVEDVLSDVYDQIKPRLEQAFQGRRVTYELQLPQHRTTRDERFYEVVYEPRLENPHDPYVVVVIIDITERKRMQVTLERLVEERTARLRETIGELELFSYSMAHDMRAPLRAMQGFSEILDAEYGTTIGEGRDYLRRIASSARRLDLLIQDVLSYSKLVRDELTLAPTDPEKLLAEILESYPNLQAGDAEIQIESPLPLLLANRAALTQVLSNLLGNAVKFVPPGVRPRVRVRAGRAEKGFARLWIEDNGIGIPAEAQDSIFMMFQRLNAPGDYEGTGIGLTIVRKAVEKMGGRVGVESEPGKGSRFWIELKTAEGGKNEG